MKIATWNVNSIKARLENAERWLKDFQPDVVCMQEIKCIDENFPSQVFEDLGYNVAVHGQKTYNGVALLSKTPMEDILIGLPGDESDDHARFIEATITTQSAPVRVASLYLPNGNPTDTPKYPYKLSWMDRLITHAEELLKTEEPFVLAGDYNVIPTEDDVWDSKAWWGDALYRQETLDQYRRLTNLGLTDGFRTCHGQSHRYSFWDYQRGAWQKDHGIRIDNLLMSPQAADRLKGADIDRSPRGWERPSDHTPVWVEID